jgi:hypothetical protein
MQRRYERDQTCRLGSSAYAGLVVLVDEAAQALLALDRCVKRRNDLSVLVWKSVLPGTDASRTKWSSRFTARSVTFVDIRR